ncbi:hypothetical protein E2562_032230 [Oryza meyeriana var. granulata]|uniref:Uncharacterized protein n=1 Tax=Oryza meyeriana var. granulata TaxID=110450 RepID=A0A6G1DA68_9ORYZ|nr:hypothetical protein E2562_032230 [Oryza meyeriana var. granulata]
MALYSKELSTCASLRAAVPPSAPVIPASLTTGEPSLNTGDPSAQQGLHQVLADTTPRRPMPVTGAGRALRRTAPDPYLNTANPGYCLDRTLPPSPPRLAERRCRVSKRAAPRLSRAPPRATPSTAHGPSLCTTRRRHRHHRVPPSAAADIAER